MATPEEMDAKMEEARPTMDALAKQYPEALQALGAWARTQVSEMGYKRIGKLVCGIVSKEK